tara:strand:- start:786 stop:1907 length:1122 start_codon:yes stop_codon:yes gene_type:complete
MHQKSDVIIISSSAIEHANSLLKSGFNKKNIYCLDNFNDEDLNVNKYLLTSESAEELDKYLKIIDSASKKNTNTLIITKDLYIDKFYKSSIFRKLKFRGNKFSTIIQLKNIKDLYSQLKELKIKTPDTYFNPPEENMDYYIKKHIYGSGGTHIKSLEKESKIKLDKGEYVQKFIKGQTYSVVFICDIESNFKIIGINEIYYKKTSTLDFVFSGAYSNVRVSTHIQKKINRIIDFFVSNYNLIGINSFDFIVNDDLFFLEINPRITETCFMYDHMFENGYINAHINSFKSTLNNISNNKFFFGFEHLFADEDIVIKDSFPDVNYISNIPKLNTKIKSGEPICTVHANSVSEKDLRRILDRNSSFIKNKLNYNIV